MAPIAYLTHGGGPLPLLGDPGHQQLVASLQSLAAALPRPKAIILVSAHWEAEQATVTGAAQPELIYDYYGFPEAAYQLRYPAPGDPALAQSLVERLQAAGLAAGIDTRRGFDHGMFVPLSLMFAQASVPVVQLSLLHSLDPAAHLAMGRALAPLLEGPTGQQVMLIGSGSSFHNMQVLMGRGGPQAGPANLAFEQWLQDTCCDPALAIDEREQRLTDWQQAPHARFCHPREEHLLPLLVCAGAAGRPAARVFKGAMGAVQVSSLLW
ncbi:MAG: class III extradiol ring-cleavage dioxygenase [Alcanivorax sp.]|nr:class III extradiol ring-cleavage dioxygenase [Alcanivorax sp.]